MTVSVSTLTTAIRPYECIEPAWTGLARRLSRPFPFDQPAWHATWWSRFGGDRVPLYLTVEDGDSLVAVAPLMRDGETLALAGDPRICDYTSLPIAVDRSPAVIDAVFTGLDALDWRTFHLWGLPEDSPGLAAAIAWGQERGYRVEQALEAVCPRIALPTTWEEYLAALTKKDRHELKRKLRRLTEAGDALAVRALSEPAEIEPALDTFFHWHRLSRLDKAEFMTPAMEAFFREMVLRLAHDGLTRLYLVDLDGRPVAALLAFHSGDEVLLYNSGYDPALAHASAGVVSKALTVRAAIEAGMRTFDFMRGDEPYKYDLGARDRAVRQLWINRDE